MDIAIVDFEEAHAQAFARLNRAWLDGHDLYEDADSKQLYSPRATILDPGGVILVALDGDRVVGTCAVVPTDDPGTFELAKLAVAAEARGQGLGRRLTEHAIDRARTLGARRIVLVSSSKLATALRLYQAMNFVSKPLPAGVPYATADVYMELDLAPAKV